MNFAGRNEPNIRTTTPVFLSDQSFDLAADLQKEIDAAERSVNRYTNNLSRQELDVASLVKCAKRAEALASLSLEGDRLTTSLVEHEMHTIAGSVVERPSVRLASVVRILDKVVELGGRTRPLGVEDILELHKLLWTRSYGEFGGRLRTPPTPPVSSRSTGPNVLPSPLTEDLLSDLVDYLARTDQPAVVQAAIAQSQLTLLCAFDSDNGIIARALSAFVLARRELIGSSILPLSLGMLHGDARKYQSCVSALGATDGCGIWRTSALESWVGRFATAAQMSCARLEACADTLEQVRLEWAGRVGGVRSGSNIERVLYNVAACPVVTSANMAELTDLSEIEVTDALERLRDADVLKRRRINGQEVYRSNVDVAADEVRRSRTRKRPRNIPIDLICGVLAFASYFSGYSEAAFSGYSAWIMYAIGLLFLPLVVVAIWKSSRNRDTAEEWYSNGRSAMASTVEMGVLLLSCFMISYWLLSIESPSHFGQTLSEVDAAYFTLSVFSTVGFGDVTAKSQLARSIVTVQMIAGFTFITILLNRVVQRRLSRSPGRR